MPGKHDLTECPPGYSVEHIGRGHYALVWTKSHARLAYSKSVAKLIERAWEIVADLAAMTQ